MIKNDNRRLANVKTRTEVGLEYVLNNINLNTPYGKKMMKDYKPFYPGEEELLREELEKLGHTVEFVKNQKLKSDIIQETFMYMKDCVYTIKRAKENVLAVVELFELKSLLLQMTKLRKTILEPTEDSSVTLLEEYIPRDIEELLNVLDPTKDRVNTFYIYDQFSEKLSSLREEKKELERAIRKQQKANKERIRKEYGVTLTPKFDLVVSKNDIILETVKSIPDLEQLSEDYVSVNFKLKDSPEVMELIAKGEALNTEIEDEELIIREMLSKKISANEELLLDNLDRIAKLDIILSKALYAIAHRCIKPEIVEEHIVDFTDGRQIQVEDILISKGKKYCPVSIKLAQGITCITGANMGGKTISLKLAGLIPMLAQYGFFVPCERATIGLSNYMQILIGDSQSVERGLSSFGSEMEELKQILDNSMERSILLIDEIASGTNPVEGLALTKSLVDYLNDKPYITLITTHFETVTEKEGVVNLQVRGLADVDFKKLDSDLRYANRKERINVIGKYMDYRLYVVEENREIPKDALNIAKMLGISKEIIEGAQKYIK